MHQRPLLVAALVFAGLVVFPLHYGSCSSAPSTSHTSAENDSGRIASASFRNVFADVAATMTPTVVSVILTKIDTVSFYRNPFYRFFGGDSSSGNPFDFFFGPPQNQNPRRKQRPDVEKRTFRQQAQGSGVIVSSDGYILTNYHVISGANEIQVKLADERSFDARIVGSDSLSDVAVIKLKSPPANLPVAALGNDENLRPGDWALAIGNPFSLSSTVTLGIISAKGRRVGNPDLYQNFLQTDAAINPGNSGGALVDIDGKVIGINTMIYTETGGFMGIGFAIPITMAKHAMDDLIKSGRVIRGWIGIAIQDIDQQMRQALDLGHAR
jgi:serine protease Do